MSWDGLGWESEGIPGDGVGNAVGFPLCVVGGEMRAAWSGACWAQRGKVCVF